MFPIHVQLTVSTPADLAKLNEFVASFYGHAVATAPKLPEIVDPVLAQHVNTLAAAVEAEQEVAAAPVEKPKKAKTPAPSPAPVEPAAPSPTTVEPEAAQAPAAAPAPTEPVTEAFDYAVLQKAVLAAVQKHGRATLEAISTKHGAPSFKALPASAWAAAHADVVALG